MSEYEEKPEQKEGLPILSNRESILRTAKRLAEAGESARTLTKAQEAGLVQMGSTIIKAMENFERSAGGIVTALQSPLMRDALYASQHWDKIIEEARKRAEMIAKADIMAGAGIHLPYPPDLRRFSKGLVEVEEAIDAIPEDIEQELLNQIDQMKTEIATLRDELEKLRQETKTTKKKTRGANRTTRDKITRLAEHRQEAIDQRGIVPGWISSCHYIEVDSRSVLAYAPELGEKWEDKTYRWKGFNID